MWTLVVLRSSASLSVVVALVVISRESSRDPGFYAAQHDPDVGMLFQHVLDMQNRDVSWNLASVPLSSGGLGLRRHP